MAKGKKKIKDDPFFVFGKEVYKYKKERIDEEYKMRVDWINKYSQFPESDRAKLDLWKFNADDKLDHSSVGPEARDQVF